MSKTCKYVLTKGNRKNKTCDKQATSDNLCARHRSMVADSLARENNNNQLMTKLNEDNTSGNKESEFMIVINSNKTPQALGDDGIQQFQSVIDNLFNNETSAILLFIDEIDSGLSIPLLYKQDPTKLISVNLGSAMEIGDKQSRLHANGFIAIFHRTYIRVNLNKLRHHLRESLGYNCNLFVQTKKASLHNYAFKQVGK